VRARREACASQRLPERSQNNGVWYGIRRPVTVSIWRSGCRGRFAAGFAGRLARGEAGVPRDPGFGSDLTVRSLVHPPGHGGDPKVRSVAAPQGAEHFRAAALLEPHPRGGSPRTASQGGPGYDLPSVRLTRRRETAFVPLHPIDSRLEKLDPGGVPGLRLPGHASRCRKAGLRRDLAHSLRTSVRHSLSGGRLWPHLLELGPDREGASGRTPRQENSIPLMGSFGEAGVSASSGPNESARRPGCGVGTDAGGEPASPGSRWRT